jgi:hypothetical protein
MTALSIMIKKLIQNYQGMLLIILFLMLSVASIAQEPPPRPVVVTTVPPGLGFGAFTQGAAGGTVTINSGGSRSSTGDVILLGLGIPFSTAAYQLVGNQGTVISILNGPDVSLTGSGGGSMILHLGVTNPLSPFVITTIPPAYMILNIGGSLTVGSPAANPPGNYSGTFNITFIQE